MAENFCGEDATIAKRHMRATLSYAEMREKLGIYLTILEKRSQSGDVGLLESIAIKTIIEELSEIINAE